MKKNKLILAICFVAICIAIGTYVKTKRSRLLSDDTSETFAIYEKVSVHVNTGPVSYFSYTVKGVAYELDAYGRFSSLRKGDTVIISYSNSDPSVAEVIDPKPDWNQ